MYTILICDDDKDIVSALDIYLTSEGYRTLKAYNGREAIRAVEQNKVHLILMDVMMPELDGIVGVLESNSLELEDSLRSYERGVALLAALQGRLAEAQQKVDVLMGELVADADDGARDTSLS